MHQVLLLNETLNRYFRMTIDRTGVDLGEARAEPFDRLLEGLERTSFTEDVGLDHLSPGRIQPADLRWAPGGYTPIEGCWYVSRGLLHL